LNEQEFLEGVSIPRNKELMRIFKDLDMVEQLGSGVPRIVAFYDVSCFKFSQNFLRMTFMVEQNDDTITSGQISGQIGGQIGRQIVEVIQDLTSRQKQVLAIIAKDDKISRSAITKQMGISESAVSKHLGILKEKGYIERIGGTRGYWKIKRENN
jgi:ATP-dependent DNA helicase RecG